MMQFIDADNDSDVLHVSYTPEELCQTQWKEFEIESLALLNMLRERQNAESLATQLAELNATAGGTSEEYITAQLKLNSLIKQAWELKPKFTL